MRHLHFAWPRMAMPGSFMLVLFFLLGMSGGCKGQDTTSPPPKSTVQIPNNPASSPNNTTSSPENKHYLNATLLEEKDLPKGVISETTTDHYPSKTFHFHNEEGKEVKTIREDQFPNNNPIFKLPFPKDTNWQETGLYYLLLSTFDEKTGKEHRQVSVAEKIKAFNTLRKYNLQVKAPETATIIIGSPNESMVVVTPPLSQYLVRCETASIYYEYAKETRDADGRIMSNSLLDCSYITVYNHLGEAVRKVLVPDKLIKVGWISDDGKYLFCSYTLGFIGEEGIVSGAFIVIDLQSQAIIPINIPYFQEYADGISGFFAEGYFQMQCGGKSFLYINPYNRTYYTVLYDREQIKDKRMTRYTSFTPFEGMKIDLSQHQKYTY